MGQFGSEGPAAEEAAGKRLLKASFGSRHLHSASQRSTDVIPGVLASASRQCFTHKCHHCQGDD